MSITIPLLLLIFGVLTFWLLMDSKINWTLKIASVSLFCIFTVVFYSSISTFLGWSALKEDIPEKMIIRAVVVKEPSFSLNVKGRIYFLLDVNKTKYKNKLLNMFGYESEKSEPRLFSVPYSRSLHEELQKEVIPRLKDGQVVAGTLKKGKGDGKGNGKSGKGKDGKGSGSESQDQEYHFYNLKPSDIQRKELEISPNK